MVAGDLPQLRSGRRRPLGGGLLPTGVSRGGALRLGLRPRRRRHQLLEPTRRGGRHHGRVPEATRVVGGRRRGVKGAGPRRCGRRCRRCGRRCRRCGRRRWRRIHHWRLGYRRRVGAGEAQRSMGAGRRFGDVAEAGRVVGDPGRHLPGLDGRGGLLGTDDPHTFGRWPWPARNPGPGRAWIGGERFVCCLCAVVGLEFVQKWTLLRFLRVSVPRLRAALAPCARAACRSRPRTRG